MSLAGYSVITTSNICACCADCITATLKCSTRSGVPTLCGYPEYIPSSPPLRYRTKTHSGTVFICNYHGTTCAPANLFQVLRDEWAGVSCSYNASTCIATRSSDATRFAKASPTGTCPLNSGGTPSAFGYGCADLYPFASDINTRVQTATSEIVSGSGACGIRGGDSVLESGSHTETLSNQDTEADAITRFQASTSYGAFAVCTAPSCCTAKWEQRTTSITFGYADAQWRVFQTSLTVGQLYYAHVPIYRRPYGTSPTWTLYQTLVTSGTTSVTGVLSIDGQVPNDVGFESYADQPCVVVPKH